MKQKLIFGIAAILFLNLVSCESDEPVGKWDDSIKLSKKEVNFSAESDSVIITTEGTWWWVNEVSLNGKMLDLDGIDTTKENFTIEKTEFSFERKNYTEIFISMQPNPTESERILIIGLQDGNYFDGIKILQSGN